MQVNFFIFLYILRSIMVPLSRFFFVIIYALFFFVIIMHLVLPFYSSSSYMNLFLLSSSSNMPSLLLFYSSSSYKHLFLPFHSVITHEPLSPFLFLIIIMHLSLSLLFVPMDAAHFLRLYVYIYIFHVRECPLLTQQHVTSSTQCPLSTSICPPPRCPPARASRNSPAETIAHKAEDKHKILSATYLRCI